MIECKDIPKCGVTLKATLREQCTQQNPSSQKDQFKK
jgi:hypothetical protein